MNTDAPAENECIDGGEVVPDNCEPTAYLDLRPGTSTFTYEGRSHRFDDLSESIMEALDDNAEDALSHLERIVKLGELRDRHGRPIVGSRAERVRSRLLTEQLDSAHEGRTLGTHIGIGAHRELIEGVMPWGTIPMFHAPPKSGKSTVRCDLVAALANPSRDFLGRWAVTATDAERDRGVAVIVTEGDPGLDEREMIRQVGKDHTDRVVMWHLEHEGGAHLFDLTDPEIFERWKLDLVHFETGDGSDDLVPFFVVVDNITAIAAALGLGYEYYPRFIAAFRRLLRSVEIENGLVIAHSGIDGKRALGGSESSAGSDGLWSLRTGSLDNPDARRRFSVIPRLGGAAVPPAPVRLGEGRLWAGADTSDDDGGSDREEIEEPSPEAALASLAAELRLNIVGHRETSGAWPTTRALRELSGMGWERTKAVRDLLLASRELIEQKRQGRGGGVEYIVPDSDPHREELRAGERDAT